MNPQSAFVTGGSGFIGGRLIRRLVEEGWSVRALARSKSSADAVRSAGAEAVRGDLEDVTAMREGADGSALTFHAAAQVTQAASREPFVRANVVGTMNALRASREAGVRRFVHVGTEAAILNGQPLHHVDETAPLRPESKDHYCATKALAEQAVRHANADGFETVVVRPRFVWGPGDTTIVPGIVEAVESGRFRWVGGGRHLASNTHVDNAVEGLVLAAAKGRAGGVYFVTDGEPVVFRDFVTRLLEAHGVTAPDGSIPYRVASFAAAASDEVWRRLRLRGAPPVGRLGVWATGLEMTIDISRARRELGYEPVRTIDDGMEELRRLHRSHASDPPGTSSPSPSG